MHQGVKWARGNDGNMSLCGLSSLGEECKRGEFVSRTTRPPAQILSGLEVVPMVALTWIEA